MSTTTTVPCPDCTSECRGVIKGMNQLINYECASIFIPKFIYSLCANCFCTFSYFKILTLPTKGTLSLNGVPVTVNQQVSAINNGKLLYVKTSAEIDTTDTFTYNITTSCGVSGTVTNTINIITCSANPCCC